MCWLGVVMLLLFCVVRGLKSLVVVLFVVCCCSLRGLCCRVVVWRVFIFLFGRVFVLLRVRLSPPFVGRCVIVFVVALCVWCYCVCVGRCMFVLLVVRLLLYGWFTIRDWFLLVSFGGIWGFCC